MVKRSRLEVYFNVLEVIEYGTEKPTRIMYETNLCWTSLHEVLDTLLNSGFIEVAQKKKSKRYHITSKGKNALSYHIKSLEGLQPHPNLL